MSASFFPRLSFEIFLAPIDIKRMMLRVPVEVPVVPYVKCPLLLSNLNQRYCRQSLPNLPNIKFHGNAIKCFKFPCGQTDGGEAYCKAGWCISFCKFAMKARIMLKCLYLIKHHDITTCLGVDVLLLHAIFLTTMDDKSDLTNFTPNCFTPGEVEPSARFIGDRAGVRVSLDVVTNKFTAPTKNLVQILLPKANHYTDCGIRDHILNK